VPHSAENRKRTAPATVSGDRDEPFKLLAGSLLRRMGYVTRVNVPLDIDVYAERYKRGQATDLDVLAVRFDGDLHEHRIVVECKSGAGRAMEEMLKLTATVRFFDAERGWLIKKQIADNARQSAQRLGVRPLDDAELRLLLAGHDLDADYEGGVERRLLGRELAMLDALEGQDGFARLTKYCASDVWLREHWESVHNLVYLLERRASNGLDLARDDHRFIVFRAATLVHLSLLRLASDIVGWSASKVERGVQLYLYGGPAARRDRERLADQIRQLVDSPDSDDPLDPPWIGDLVEVVAALIRNSGRAGDSARCLQDAERRYFLDADGEVPAPADVWDDVTMKLAKDAIRFTCKASGVNTSVAREFLAS